jgi:hypothetical protein
LCFSQTIHEFEKISNATSGFPETDIHINADQKRLCPYQQVVGESPEELIHEEFKAADSFDALGHEKLSQLLRPQGKHVKKMNKDKHHGSLGISPPPSGDEKTKGGHD